MLGWHCRGWGAVLVTRGGRSLPRAQVQTRAESPNGERKKPELAQGETPRSTLSEQTQKGPNPARDGLCLLSKKSCSSGG